MRSRQAILSSESATGTDAQLPNFLPSPFVHSPSGRSRNTGGFVPMPRPWIPFLIVLAIPATPAFPAAVAPGSPASPPAPACRELKGASDLLAPGRVLLLGEMHGTNESPELVADLACQALAGGWSVTVALEQPRTLAAATEAFLASDGGAAAREALLADRFWTEDLPDGRSSEAMFRLLDALRRFRRDGRPVAVALIDPSPHPPTQGERDRALAAAVAEAAKARPRDLVISLT